MQNSIKPGVVVLVAWLMSCRPAPFQPARLVNPFIGTGGHGHTYPGATLPFGMVQLSPDTRVVGWDACSGYHYSDSTLLGFSHTHLSGTGAADYGDILFTPRLSSDDTLALAFHHHQELARAGYYEVELANGIRVRLTATLRTGIQQYHFPDNGRGYVEINLQHGIGPDRLRKAGWEATSGREVAGYRFSSGWARDQTIYFVSRFSHPYQIIESDSAHIRLAFELNDEPLLIKTGLSAVSTDNARLNLQTEAGGHDFEELLNEATETWNRALSRIEASFSGKETDTIFYTALYHSMLAPNVFSDVNGQYRGLDKQTHQAGHPYYTVFSLWDTFRATHPLYTLLTPATNTDMINTMLLMYRQGGLLPVWELAANETGTMIGYHAVPVIADAMAKGLPGFDYNLALEAMQASARQNHLGLKYYKEMGYIPAEKEHESVSKTLEYAYDDWCIGMAADLLGQATTARYYYERSRNYQHVYDPASGFMRPRRNGNWLQPFDPYEVSGNYTEANAWQYNLFVPHDISYLDTLYQPHSTLAAKLDSLFRAPARLSGRSQPDISGMIGQYAHGNEPSHNYAYLYNYTGQPWKTQELVHRIMTGFYRSAPDGLIGNEDCGQMSAWYVFSALGFYPVVPGRPEYALGTPLVRKALLRLENDRYLEIEVKRKSNSDLYIERVVLNDTPLNRTYLTHNEITEGGKLVFYLTGRPDTLAQAGWQRPRSRVPGPLITPVPVIDGGEMTFLDSARVRLSSPLPGSRIFYTLDGTPPDSLATPYRKPFTLTASTRIRAMAYAPGRLPSRTAEARFVKIPFRRAIMLRYPYSHLYTGNSSMALIDHIRGGYNFRDGWQGFHEVDLDAIVDLGAVQPVSRVSAGFFQDPYSWIFYPEKMVVELSLDGENFASRKIIQNLVPPQAGGPATQDLTVHYNRVPARYVRVRALNIGRCPDWHKGAGHPAWLFADEIVIETP